MTWNTARALHAARVVCAALIGGLLPTIGLAADAAADQVLEEKVLKIVREHPREIIEAVTTYQRAEAERREKAAVNKLSEALAKVPAAELLGDSPTRGANNDKLLLVEFSDFQCPYCARAFATVQRFMQAHDQEVRLVYKHLPLTDQHPEAANAARAAWAAGQQGKFWEYHDGLFKAQDLLGDKRYTDLASELGLDLTRFNRDRNGEAAGKALERDLALAKRLGINSTPLFVLNKLPIAGAAPQAEFERLLGVAKAALGQ